MVTCMREVKSVETLQDFVNANLEMFIGFATLERHFLAIISKLKIHVVNLLLVCFR